MDEAKCVGPFQAVLEWMRTNILKLNPDKTKVLLVNRKSGPGFKMPSILDGVVLPLKDQVHSLEALLGPPSILLDNQMATVARSGFYQVHLVTYLQLFLGCSACCVYF